MPGESQHAKWVSIMQTQGGPQKTYMCVHIFELETGRVFRLTQSLSVHECKLVKGGAAVANIILVRRYDLVFVYVH